MPADRLKSITSFLAHRSGKTKNGKPSDEKNKDAGIMTPSRDETFGQVGRIREVQSETDRGPKASRFKSETRPNGLRRRQSWAVVNLPHADKACSS